MSERKVLNKYYPPDFDVTKLPKLHLSRDRQFVIRIMSPFSMRCKTCGDYIYKGRKFNARQETVQNETYLGLRKFRFYIRCPTCLAEITFKTDPENTDYEMEEGATRNFQAYRFAEQQQEKQRLEKEEEELNNPMKALENRTQDSKNEMELIEKLEELKDINKRHAVIDHEKLIQEHMKVEKECLSKQEEEDENLIKSVFGKSDGGYVKRLQDSESDSDDDFKPTTSQMESANNRKRTATDILTEEHSTTVEPAKKRFASSSTRTVGFSSKLSSLGQLVKKKVPKIKGQSETLKSGLGISLEGRKIGLDIIPLNNDQINPVNDNSIIQKRSDESQKSNSLLLLGGYDSSSSSNDDD